MGFARVGILGLGYVGLPLAVALAAHRPVVGFDIDAGRIADIATGLDRTQEVSADALAAVAASLTVTADEQGLRGCDLLIATVPTPIDADQKPDLTALEAASRTIGRVSGGHGRPVRGLDCRGIGLAGGPRLSLGLFPRAGKSGRW
jgi:UDP-N-acetyl-D-galactosamine dehydrogenase